MGPTLNTTGVRRKRSPRSFSRRRRGRRGVYRWHQTPEHPFAWLEAGRFLIRHPPNDDELFPDAICVIGGPEAGRGPVMENFDSCGVRAGPHFRSPGRMEKRPGSIALRTISTTFGKPTRRPLRDFWRSSRGEATGLVVSGAIRVYGSHASREAMLGEDGDASPSMRAASSYCPKSSFICTIISSPRSISAASSVAPLLSRADRSRSSKGRATAAHRKPEGHPRRPSSSRAARLELVHALLRQ